MTPNYPLLYARKLTIHFLSVHMCVHMRMHAYVFWQLRICTLLECGVLSIFYSETRSHHTAWAGLKLSIFLPQPSLVLGFTGVHLFTQLHLVVLLIFLKI